MTETEAAVPRFWHAVLSFVAVGFFAVALAWRDVTLLMAAFACGYWARVVAYRAISATLGRGYSNEDVQYVTTRLQRWDATTWSSVRMGIILGIVVFAVGVALQEFMVLSNWIAAAAYAASASVLTIGALRHSRAWVVENKERLTQELDRLEAHWIQDSAEST